MKQAVDIRPRLLGRKCACLRFARVGLSVRFTGLRLCAGGLCTSAGLRLPIACTVKVKTVFQQLSAAKPVRS